MLYPRAATLGGCTAHNAMIFVLPHDSDWDGIAALTGDASWRAANMRRYAKRVENCRHRPFWRCAARRWASTRWATAGAAGCSTERAMPLEAFFDVAMLRLIIDTTADRDPGRAPSAGQRVARAARPRRPERARASAASRSRAPATRRCPRRATGAWARANALLDVRERMPDRLHIELDALATRVLFDDQQRAIGVEYRKGRHLYRAHAEPGADPASCARCARGARSCCAAARSTRRSC